MIDQLGREYQFRCFAHPPISWIDTGQVDLGNELDLRRGVGIILPAVYVQAVDTILMNTLQIVFQYIVEQGQDYELIREGDQGLSHSNLTLRGHLRPRGRMNKNLHLCRRYAREKQDQNLPAPWPFSPFSNSSRRRKFLGTFAPIIDAES